MSEAERLELAAQASEAQDETRSAWRLLMRRLSWAAVVVAALYAILWWATLQFHLDVRKTVVSTGISAGVMAAIGLFSAWQSRVRVSGTKEFWERAIREAEENLVVEMHLTPVQAWKADGRGWLLDLGDGRGLWAEWELPEDWPTTSMLVRAAYSGMVWIDQAGDPCPLLPLGLDWARLSAEHPLVQEWGPAVFRLDPNDPVGSLLSFKEWAFPLGSEPRSRLDD